MPVPFLCAVEREGRKEERYRGRVFVRRACAGIQGKADRTLDHEIADGQIAAGCSQHGGFVFVQRLGATNRNMMSAVLHMQNARRRGDNADGGAVPAQHAISARWVRKDRNGLLRVVYDSETSRKEKHAGTSRNPAKNRHGGTNGKKRPFHRLLPAGNGFQDRPPEPSNDSPCQRYPFGARSASRPGFAHGDIDRAREDEDAAGDGPDIGDFFV